MSYRECKNLVVITGISCQGKTYISAKLRDKYKLHIIHMDLLYHYDKTKPRTQAEFGVLDDLKKEFIKKQRRKMTETTIIEGTQIGNQAELDMFVEELDFDGEVYKFRIDSPNIKEQFKSKHPKDTEKIYNGITKSFNSLYSLTGVVIVIKDLEDIIKFLEDEDNVHLSRPY